MEGIRNVEQLARVEYCLRHYIGTNIGAVMDGVCEDVRSQQRRELAEYVSSGRGILSRAAANLSNNIFYNPVETVRDTGEWSGKTAEDFVRMCGDKILSSENLQNDLLCLADEWRTAIVEEIGRERYDRLSADLGDDLALAYIDHRVEQTIVDRMIEDEIPKSSIEYVLTRGQSNSLIGFGRSMVKTPLQREISDRAAAMYRPGAGERLASRAVSFGVDAVTTGGISTWGSLARLAGAEAVFAGVDAYLDARHEADKAMTVEECISMGAFNTRRDVFEPVRQHSHHIIAYEDAYVKELRARLKNPLGVPSERPVYGDLFRPERWASSLGFDKIKFPVIPIKTIMHNLANNNTAKEDNTKTVSKGATNSESPAGTLQAQSYADTRAETVDDTEMTHEETTAGKNEQSGPRQDNTNGWDSILSTLGLDHFGDITHNLGYVIAMLPDMLIGMFTGKTQSVGIRKDLVPLASIVTGMFVKNPLLKLLLVGMGGANLLNKVGHEAIDRQNANTAVRYKTYEDQPLDPRITSLTLNGDILLADIDGVPCTVRLPATVTEAHARGALPLNTLANAILRRSDLTAIPGTHAVISENREQVPERTVAARIG